jgi:hypothetical protein
MASLWRAKDRTVARERFLAQVIVYRFNLEVPNTRNSETFGAAALTNLKQ